MDIPNELIDSIRNRKAILFAGAGLSMNLGLPSFNTLIEHLAGQLDFDKDLFRLSGDTLSLTEYYHLQKKGLGELTAWMDSSWHKDEIDISQSIIHKTLVELDFPIIYTTNYDKWLEKAYQYWGKDYEKIVNVADIAKAKPGVTKIIKFHGDFDDEKSIVLTESSYFERMSFESPLDIRLRSDVLGKSILFLGYSLSDMNVRYLLYKLQEQWKTANTPHDRPSSFIFLTKPNLIQEEIMTERKIKPIVSECDDPKEAVEGFLTGLLAEVKK